MVPRPRIGRWLAPALVVITLAVSSSVPDAAAPIATSSVVMSAAANATPLAAGAMPAPAAIPPAILATIAGTAANSASPVDSRSAVAPAKAAPHEARQPKPEPRPKEPVKPAKPKPVKPSPPVTYRGTNHLWIPFLGINRSVSSFPCSRTQPPDNYVYRWGCAGHNNIYLMGHAYSVFKPLHDAYVSGRLRKGMRVTYADGGGRVRTYAVSFWRLASPVGSSWAYAAQARPSLTLQTCVGSRSQYRLVVRLVAI